jgi:hypothetical protein
MAGETECCQEADEADDTQAQGLGVLIDAIERVRRVLLSGGELDADDVQALQNTGDVLIDFAGSLRGEDPLPSDRQRGLTEAEYRAVRFAVLRGMWTEGGICRHCGRREAAPDDNPHAEWCVARVALAAAERLRGPTVPKGAAAADLEIAARRGQDPAAAEQAAPAPQMRAARDALIGRATVAGARTREEVEATLQRLVLAHARRT